MCLREEYVFVYIRLSEIVSVVIRLRPPYSYLFTIEVACCDPVKWMIVMSATAGQWFILCVLHMHTYRMQDISRKLVYRVYVFHIFKVGHTCSNFDHINISLSYATFIFLMDKNFLSGIHYYRHVSNCTVMAVSSRPQLCVCVYIFQRLRIRWAGTVNPCPKTWPTV